MRLKTLLISMLMLTGFSMANAEIVELGTADNSGVAFGLPTSNGYDYGVSQQLYWYYEVGASRELTSIAFYNNSTNEETRLIDLYLSNTTRISFDTASDWGTVTEEGKVFSGPVTFTPGEWTTITFDKPFEYDSDYNLLVTMDDNTGGYSGSFTSFMSAYTSGLYSSIQICQDGVDYNPLDMGTEAGWPYYYKNMIRFNGEEHIVGLPNGRHLPLDVYWSYTVSQQIYTYDEINKKGLINSIAFFNVGDEKTRLIDLYIVPTSVYNFSSNTDWLIPAESDKVFSGEITFKAGQWTPIRFFNPILYNGTDNLAVIMVDKTGYVDGRTGFASYTSMYNQSLFDVSDTSPYDATDGSLTSINGNMDNIKCQIRFEFDDADFVGDGGTAVDENLPTNGWYYRSLSQQIYTKEELGDAKEITSISFHNTGSELERKLDIYLVANYTTDFADGNSWIPFSESNRVYSGWVTFYEEDWTTIPLQTPFNYNGKTSVVLVVADNTDYYYDDVPFSVFTAPNKTLYIVSDDYETFPKSEDLVSVTGLVLDVKNQIKLNAVDENLARPTNLNIPDSTPYSFTLNWGGEGSQWELQYQEYGESSWKIVKGLTEPRYEITDLKAYTYYHVRLRIVYEDGSVSKWTAFDYLTSKPYPYDVAVSVAPTSATIDWKGYGESYEVRYCNASNYELLFFDDFENGFSSKGWTRIANKEYPAGVSDGWALSSENHTSTTYSFSGRYSPVSYSWTHSPYTSYDADNWLISPLVDLKGTLSFWQYVGNDDGEYCDSYEVKLSTSGNAISDFVYTLRTMAPGEPGWHEVRFDLSAYEGEKGYIAIHHLDYDKIDLRIDNFYIFNGEMNYVHTTETELTLSGLQPNTEYLYQIYNHKNGEIGADTGTLTFTTLPTNPVPYDVVVEPGVTSADISWSGFSDSYKVRYRTAEATEEVTLFFDDFDSGDFSTKGWTIHTEGEKMLEDGWMIYDTSVTGINHPHSGNCFAYSQSYNNTLGEVSTALDADNWLVTPKLDLKGVLKFWEKAQDSSWPDLYEVLLSTTGNEIADFTTTLRPMGPSSNSGWTEVEIDLSAYEGQQGYIAIHHKDNDKFWLDIDDFGLYETKVTQPAGEWQEIETTEPHVTITGLDKEATYEYQIVGIKAGQEDASTAISTFTTIIPIDIAFDAQDENTGIIAANNGQYGNVTIENYTIKKDGKWYSISLPFDVTLEGSILEGATVRQPSDAKEVDTYLIIDCLTECDKIEAGKPYLIKFDAGEDIVNPVFKDVKISDSTEPTKLYGDKIYVIPEYNKFFVGPTDDFYYTTDGNLRLARINLQKDYAMGGFTCSFYINSSLNSGLDGIGLNFGDMNILDLITGISGVKTSEEEPTTIYNVAGQRLSKTQKGINIVNGNKVLVK